MSRNRKKRPADAKTRERGDQQEWTKLVFDYYKQLATFSGVGAAVVLAVFQQEILGAGLVRLALVLFAVCALACVYGMWRLLIWFDLYFDRSQRSDLPLLAQVATALFSNAVLSLLLSTFDPPAWLVYASFAVLVGALAWGLQSNDRLAGWLARVKGVGRRR
jgi:hypothetical protein